MWEYTDKVIDHFLHPRNVGEVQDPDGIGEVGAVRRAKSRYNLEPVYLQTLEQIESFLFFFKTALQMIVLIERVARKNIRERDKGLDNFMPNRKDVRPIYRERRNGICYGDEFEALIPPQIRHYALSSYVCARF